MGHPPPFLEVMTIEVVAGQETWKPQYEPREEMPAGGQPGREHGRPGGRNKSPLAEARTA